ncbi:MAG: DJ-1/PfpI family protein [Clostridia bacterium]|nr:DJ-1/PfpI family protein [Clostridia bacterium]
MVYVFLAEGFEEIEAIATIDILRRCGLSVQTVSITDEKNVCGSHGIPVTADALLAEIDPGSGKAFVLPGGLPGSDNLQNCKPLEKILKTESRNGKIIAAICAAPKVLGAFDLLEGRLATCYPGFEEELIGAEFVPDRAVLDGNIITSRGAGTASDFAFLIAKTLGKDPKPVRDGMLYDI